MQHYQNELESGISIIVIIIRLADMRSQKKKLSRQLHEKEEEMEVVTKKVDQLRQDLRKSEKSKSQVMICFYFQSSKPIIACSNVVRQYFCYLGYIFRLSYYLHLLLVLFTSY